MFLFPGWIGHTWFYLDGYQSKRIVRAFVKGAWIGLSLMTMLVGLLLWRLSSAPISMAFLKQDLVTTIEDSHLPVNVNFDNLTLSLRAPEDAPLGFYFEIENVRILQKNNIQIAAAPKVLFNFTLGALLTGHFAPNEITLDQPTLYAVKNMDGSHDLGFSPTLKPERTEKTVLSQAPSKPKLKFKDFVFNILSAKDNNENIFADIQQINISNGFLSVENKQTGHRWFAPAFNLHIKRNMGGLSGEMMARFVYNEESSNIIAKINYLEDTEIMEGSLAFEDVPPSLISEELPIFKILEGINGKFSGDVELIASEKEGLEEATLFLETKDASFNLDQVFESPIHIPSMFLKGSVTEKGKSLKINSLNVKTDDFTLKGNVTASYVDGSVHFVAHHELSNFSADKIQKYWPTKIVEPARRWITEHIKSGQVPYAWANVAGDISSDRHISISSLLGGIDIQDAVIDYLPPMPKATHLNGHAAFSKEGFRISIRNGQSISSNGDLVFLEGGAVDILGLNDHTPHIDIRLHTKSSLPAGLSFIEEKPLALMDRTKFKAKDFTGSADLNLRIAFPLVHHLSQELISVTGNAKLADVSVQDVFRDFDASDGTFDLSFDNKNIFLSGKSKVLDEFISASYEHKIGPEKQSTLTLEGPVSTKYLSALKLSNKYYRLSNKGTFKAILKQNGPQEKLSIKGDLTQNSLELPLVNWRKEEGEPAEFSAILDFRDGQLQTIKDISYLADASALNGNIQLKNGSFSTLTFSNFLLGKNKAQVSINEIEDHTFNIDVKAKQLDLASLLSGRSLQTQASLQNPPVNLLTPKDQRDPTYRFNVAVSAESVFFYKDLKLPNVSGILLLDDGTVQKIVVDSKSTTGEDQDVFHLDYAQSAGENLHVWSKNLGVLFSGLKSSVQIEQGRFNFNGKYLDGNITGRFILLDYIISGSHLLENLLNAADNPQIKEIVQKNRLSFNKFQADLAYKDHVLNIKNGANSGGSLGLTVEGDVDLATKKLNLQGTVIPLTGLNSFLGNIPLIGDIVTGGQGQGIFALAYHVAGTLEKPDVSMNPLSALAPGILRKIFFMD